MSIHNAKNNVVFIHVPKTAGTSMERREFIGGNSHARIRDFNNVGGAFKFAFVRNPWDRFVSAAFHKPNITGKEHSKEGFTEFVEKCQAMDFDLWVDHAMKSYPNGDGWPIHHHFLPQWFFLLEEDGQVGVDFVGHYESLMADWEHVCNRMGMPAHMGHAREGDHEHYTNYYNNDTWDIVGSMYKKDITLFGY